MVVRIAALLSASSQKRALRNQHFPNLFVPSFLRSLQT